MDNYRESSLRKSLNFGKVGAVAIALFLAVAGCKKDTPYDQVATSDNPPAVLSDGVVNLVSTDGVGAAHADRNLVNAWGLAFGSSGEIMVASADKGLAIDYDQSGTSRHYFSIPFGATRDGGHPTGIVRNLSDQFKMPSTSMPAQFIVATENGTIAAWGSGSSAETVSDRSGAHAVYKGVALTNIGDQWYILATDFKNARVDMFDQNYKYVGSGKFSDPSIPRGFAPFGIRQMRGRIFITYAKQLAPDNEDDEPGLGNGYVNVFTLDGSLIHRFTSGGKLNSPWGIAILRRNTGSDERGPAEDADVMSSRDVILIGNFGDGYINQYNMYGYFGSQLQSNGVPVKIDGLWAISYNPDLTKERSRLYFTAGPDDESKGLFGYISTK